MLTACGGSNDEPEPTASPTGYSIWQVDLYANPPQDICRVADKDYLEKLLQQVKDQLPVDQANSLKFRNFSVTDDVSGKGREAVLRFTVSSPSRPDALMNASGRFDEKTCAVGSIRIGKGPSPYTDSQ